MIVNFRPSNLGLFGFPLQAHAREKRKKTGKNLRKKERRESPNEKMGGKLNL